MISVLTVNYDSSADLAELIASIREHRGGVEIELIITNNSASEEVAVSGDASIPIRILTPDSNIGFAAGVNLAYRSSRGDILMIANPDIRVSEGTFDAAVRFMDASSDVGVVLPLLRSLDGSVQSSVRQFYTWAVALYARSPLRLLSQPSFFRRYLCGDMDRTRPTDVDWGLAAAMFLRRSDWPDPELFDERFFLYFEDVDLCYRVWQRGQRVTYCPHIECIHAHRRASSNPFSSAGWHHFQSFTRFLSKHGGLPQRPERAPAQAR
ncbi:MAG: glycosyltransferase family 2 protein [Planctomycetota bacterium]|nr:glycosyltransferase family 2 protein [Planctomycetota bacterium]